MTNERVIPPAEYLRVGDPVQVTPSEKGLVCGFIHPPAEGPDSKNPIQTRIKITTGPRSGQEVII